MQILTEIFRDQGLDVHGTIDHRSAVRAVAIRGRTLLMVYSPVNGDYKFPGGGVGENENPECALKREVAEECGMKLVRILRGIGSIVEYARPARAGFDIFKMTSSYYLCEVDPVIEAQHLDAYEEELCFQPAWIDVEAAIETNKAVQQVESKRPPAWTPREIFMLEYIRSHFMNSTQLTASSTAGTPPPAPRGPAR